MPSFIGHKGLNVSWKLCLNIWKFSLLRPTLNWERYDNPNGSWIPKTDLGEGRTNDKIFDLKTAIDGACLISGWSLFHSDVQLLLILDRPMFFPNRCKILWKSLVMFKFVAIISELCLIWDVWLFCRWCIVRSETSHPKTIEMDSRYDVAQSCRAQQTSPVFWHHQSSTKISIHLYFYLFCLYTSFFVFIPISSLEIYLFVAELVCCSTCTKLGSGTAIS